VLRSAGEVVVRDWGAGDVDALAGLLHVSYDAASARRFVSEPGEHSWRGYLGALIQHHACGSILPGATRMAVADGRLVGAALATELGPGTAHLAQVVVHPDWRGRGLAGDLIDEAARAARHHGRSRMTLLASASNGPAQTLYRGRGYVSCGEFVSAIRPLSRLVAKAS
jgi:ribosomal protein S18 acetylase RimI-like enzyme